MYKGYKVREIILHDYQVPETMFVLDVSVGCGLCNEAGVVQPGHHQCGVLPEELLDDDNVFPTLVHGWGWLAEFNGDDGFVDEWINE